ncbi:DsrE family protein [Sulfuricurvum sp.]|uniref:DsrE family protein n=1 Tax=Sulfuricurvum sp. TaxID=2025608 RepID=UPI002E2F4528|nr:DsrE family protein [Sulfuricurvum sp.]HEX5329791.1 DsrE family protein [Sulfuricurvum sp.]
MYKKRFFYTLFTELSHDTLNNSLARTAIVRIFFLLLCLGTFAFADTKKFMIDLKTGDFETFDKVILSGMPGTIDYFRGQGDTVEVAVVIHGDAYKFFVKNLENTQYGVDKSLVERQESIQKRLEEIEKKYQVHLEICMSGMHKKGILTEDIYPFVTPIKSAMVGLVKWQNEGYGYIPVH